MGEQPSLTSRLAEYVASTNFDALPPQVVAQAKQCLCHAFACSIAGHHLPWSRVGVNALESKGLKGRATTWVDGLKAPSTEVAMVNASMAQSTGQEDMHTDSVSHPGTIVIPAALALGEELGSSGQDVLTAIVLGYDMMGRLGAGVANPEFFKKFRTSGMFGPFGSATASAKLLGLDAEQTTNAMGMAGNLGIGLMQWAMEGSDELVTQNGFASCNGIQSAFMARSGLRASKQIIEGPGGFWNAYGCNASAEKFLTQNLGQEFEIMKAYFKVAAACYTTQTAVDLMLKMVQAQAIDPEQVEKIEIRTFTEAKEYPGGDHKGPFADLLMPKMSIPYGVSAVLVFKEISQRNYDLYQDPLVNRLTARCTVVDDPEISSQYPAQQESRIRITLSDGAVIEDAQADRRSLNNAEVVENFKTEAGRVLSGDQVQALGALIADIENVGHINELTKLLVKR